MVKAIGRNDLEEFKRLMIASGRSSWMYLQNVYAKNSEQPLCLALSLAEHMLADCGAWRVHGGGFAGTTLNMVPSAMEARFVRSMNGLFGDHASHVLSIRNIGASVVF